MQVSFLEVLSASAILLIAAPARADEVKMSLADAVRAAIAHDAELYIAREDTRIAAENIDLARSAFAPKIFGEVYGVRDDRPPTPRAFGALDTVFGGDLGLTGRLETTGLTYTLTTGFARERFESTYSSVYDPGTTATASIELVQPLWRGAFSAARRPIVVASLRKNQSEQELRAQLESTVGGVEVAYWNLVRARAERDARNGALGIATEQVEESKRLRKVGGGSDLDITEAEVGVSRRKQELLVSEQDVLAAEGLLVKALGVRAGEPGWIGTNTIVPTDTPKIEEQPLDLEAQLELARARRADVLAARERTGAEKAELAARDDQRKLAVDLVAAAGATGFAGKLANSDVTAGVNGGGLDPAYFTDPAYDGGAGKALKNLGGRDLRIFVGLRIELPLGNSEAEARHAVQQRTLARARLLERQTLGQVESEVRTTVQQVSVGARQVRASDDAIALSEKFLDGMRKRFRAGAATTFDVLRVSEELTRARVEAARVRADYQITLARLRAVTGTTLDPLRITTKNLAAAPGR
jgi:outer membrane protein TolC